MNRWQNTLFKASIKKESQKIDGKVEVKTHSLTFIILVLAIVISILAIQLFS